MRDTGVVFCRCKAGIISDEKLTEIAREVHGSKAHIIELNDLCAMSIDSAGALREINRSFRRKIVIACYPRAVENILLQAGAPFEEMTVLNFRNISVNDIKKELGSLTGESSYKVMTSNLKVPAWFPVVDKKLCSDCGQCSAFCLFGVYSYADKYLEVRNPLNCKNNCPACARACPKTAIIFPRIKEDSVIAGAEPGNNQGQQQSGLLIDRLKQRNNVQRSIFREDLLKKAEEERSRAIEEDKKSKN